MAVEKKDIEDVAEALGKKFDEFKKTNDKRIDGLEEEKGKLSGQVDTLNEKLGELDELKSALEKELTELKRPDGTGTKAASEHKTAFLQFVRKGIDAGLGELQAKALQIGTEADGGYAVPEELDRTIIELLKDASPMRQVCNQITVGSPDYKRLVSLGGAGSGWVGETDGRPATGTPTLGQISAFMGEIYSNPHLGLATYISERPLPDLRMDGPTIAEFVEAGYLAINYPPDGYASRSSQEEIDAAIEAQKEDDPLKMKVADLKVWLTAKGIEFDPSANKEALQALVPPSA